MSGTSKHTKYKAQVYDLALTAFFNLREFDSAALHQPRAETGWDIAEAFVAAAVSGVTYKSSGQDRWFEAAILLQSFADQVGNPHQARSGRTAHVHVRTIGSANRPLKLEAR